MAYTTLPTTAPMSGALVQASMHREILPEAAEVQFSGLSLEVTVASGRKNLEIVREDKTVHVLASHALLVHGVYEQSARL